MTCQYLWCDPVAWEWSTPTPTGTHFVPGSPKWGRLFAFVDVEQHFISHWHPILILSFSNSAGPLILCYVLCYSNTESTTASKMWHDGIMKSRAALTDEYRARIDLMWAGCFIPCRSNKNGHYQWDPARGWELLDLRKRKVRDWERSKSGEVTWQNQQQWYLWSGAHPKVIATR